MKFINLHSQFFLWIKNSCSRTALLKSKQKNINALLGYVSVLRKNADKLHSEKEALTAEVSDLKKLISRLESDQFRADNEAAYWKEECEEKVHIDNRISIAELRSIWINKSIDSLNGHYDGCGTYFELWEQRQYSAVSSFLRKNLNDLTQEELDYIIKKTGYREDFQPYTEADKVSGETLTIENLITREQV